MKKVLDKWQFVLSLRQDIQYLDGRKKFSIGIMKFESFPEEGSMFTKSNYKGFYREYWIRKPIERVT